MKFLAFLAFVLTAFNAQADHANYSCENKSSLNTSELTLKMQTQNNETLVTGSFSHYTAAPFSMKCEFQGSVKGLIMDTLLSFDGQSSKLNQEFDAECSVQAEDDESAKKISQKITLELLESRQGGSEHRGLFTVDVVRVTTPQSAINVDCEQK